MTVLIGRNHSREVIMQVLRERLKEGLINA